MAIRDLKDQIARLPEQPGVYLYFNAEGDTIYVGKARALRARRPVAVCVGWQGNLKRSADRLSKDSFCQSEKK